MLNEVPQVRDYIHTGRACDYWVKTGQYYNILMFQPSNTPFHQSPVFHYMKILEDRYQSFSHAPSIFSTFQFFFFFILEDRSN